MSEPTLDDALRDAARSQHVRPPDYVWEAVEARLPPAEARMRRLQPRARRRWPLLAASLLALAAVAIWLIGEQAPPQAVAVQASAPAYQDDLDLSDPQAPLIDAAVYDGVTIGDGSGTFKVCNPC